MSELMLVPTLELCQKMNDLGWSRKTKYHWLNNMEGEIHCSTTYHPSPYTYGLCYAPTLEEILDELPNSIGFTKDMDGKYSFTYLMSSDNDKWCYSDDESAINAAAKIWINIKIMTKTN